MKCPRYLSPLLLALLVVLPGCAHKPMPESPAPASFQAPMPDPLPSWRRGESPPGWKPGRYLMGHPEGPCDAGCHSRPWCLTCY